MITVVTPNTPAVRGNKITRRTIPYRVTVTNVSLNFSSNFCISFGLTQGSRVNFLNEGRSWKMYIEDRSEKDAFELKAYKKGGNGFCIYNAGLAKMIRLSNFEDAVGGGISYQIEKAPVDYRGKSLFVIDTKTKLKFRKRGKTDSDQPAISTTSS